MRKRTPFALFAVLTLCIAGSVGFGAEAGTPQSAAVTARPVPPLDTAAEQALRESLAAVMAALPADGVMTMEDVQRLQKAQAELRARMDASMAESRASMAESRARVERVKGDMATMRTALEAYQTDVAAWQRAGDDAGATSASRTSLPQALASGVQPTSAALSGVSLVVQDSVRRAQLKALADLRKTKIQAQKNAAEATTATLTAQTEAPKAASQPATATTAPAK